MNMTDKGFASIVLLVIIVLAVGAVGYFAFVKRSGPVAQQTPTSTQSTNALKTPLSPTPTMTLDKIAPWKAYAIPGQNFVMKYPDEFRLQEDQATRKIFSSQDGHFAIYIENNIKKLDAAGLKNDFEQNDEYGYRYQDSFVKVAGVDAYKQGRYDLGVIEKYSIPKSGKIYRVEFEFNFDTANQNLKESKIHFIRDVLSTFAFTDS